MKFDRVKKIIAGIILIAVSGFIAYFVKDVIDRRNPAYAIPQMTVLADNRQIPTVIGGYDWQFAFGDRVESSPGSIYDLMFEETHLKGGETIDISFSVEPVSCSVKCSDAYSYQFIDIPLKGNTAPFESGGYTYEVVANFEEGTILYYFYIVI